jgi:DNA-binding beta-propeller fold protein YncE
MRLFSKYILFTAIIIFFGSFMYLSAQVSHSAKTTAEVDDPYIKWISTLPSKDFKNKIGFFEKVFDFIVGSDPVVFNNPVNVFSRELNDFFIVNQGDGSILHFLDGKIFKPRYFKNEDNAYPSLVGICAVRSEGLYFTDSRLNKILILSDDGKQIKILNDSISLERPTGIAYSEVRDEVFVVETGAHCISVFDRSGIKKKTIGSRGIGPLEFNFPTYIWIDRNGLIYIVDSMNFRVQILSPEGNFINSFGKQGDATGFFARPRGIATDSVGNVYIADALFNVIQVFDNSGQFLYYLGTQGSGKYQFWMPSGICIDKNDFLYIADSYNGRIQIFQIIKNKEK